MQFLVAKGEDKEVVYLPMIAELEETEVKPKKQQDEEMKEQLQKEMGVKAEEEEDQIEEIDMQK
jgi:hypothetical protein